METGGECLMYDECKEGALEYGFKMFLCQDSVSEYTRDDLTIFTPPSCGVSLAAERVPKNPASLLFLPRR